MTLTAVPDASATAAGRTPTVARMFLDRVAATPRREAFRFPDAAENWHAVTWQESGEIVTRWAAGLVALGVDPEDRVAIVSGTRHEWVFSDLAVTLAGAATTTVYPTSMADDVAYILADSGSVVVFAENEEQLAKLRAKRSELPEVRTVVTFEGEGDGDWVIGLAELAALGQALLESDPNLVDARVEAITSDSLATLIYTSGTTGRPKGVRLSHGNWSYLAVGFTAGGIFHHDDLQFLWLPLAHAFGKALIVVQLRIGFATAVDGRVPKILDNMAVIRPTFMGAAPRIFEKAYGKVVSSVEEEGGAKAKIFAWAEEVALEVARLKRAGQPVPRTLAAKHSVADHLVLSKVRDRFGGRVRFFISGAATLSPEIAEWFDAAGIVILEGYGMTECSAGAAINLPGSVKFGSVGRPVPGTEIKLAEDGEILIKSPGVMQGYHHLEAATAEALVDGWLATGDIGEIDADGHLRITDRKKDLFKTSGGKYVAPAHIEGLFKGVCPLASQMVVHGSERNFVSALITLDPDAVALWAETHGMAGRSYRDVVTSPEIRALVEGHVAQLNTKLNRWETIKKFEILDADLSVESGEITPSLKLKRKVVEERYREILDGFYR